MSDRDSLHRDVLASIDENRRDFVRQLVTASAFAVPLAIAASPDGSPIREAHAQTAPTSSETSTPLGSTTTPSVPIPATLALFGGGLATLAWLHRRNRRRDAD